MFTVFHLIALLSAITGATIGATCGWHWFGWAGVIVGVIAGFVTGTIIGNCVLVGATTLFSRKLVRMTAEELRSYLHSEDCLTPNLVLLELNRRGEDIMSELPFLYSRLTSDNSSHRAHALAAMNTVFPELADRIPEYSPFAATEDCRNYAEPIKVAMDVGTSTSVAGTAETDTDE